MNPVHRHHGTGTSRRPAGDSCAGHWRHQYDRVTSHYDRCEAVRRAATFLASLIARDPDAPTGEYTTDDLREDVLIEGAGWPLQAVAERFHQDPQDIARWRTQDNRHPLTGKPWTPPEHVVFAAAAAREMKAAGLNSTTIGHALNRSSNTVRCWITNHRRAA